MNACPTSWLSPEQCEGSGAPGCASLASRAASPDQENCGWEVLVQRRPCSGPLAPAHMRKQHNISTKIVTNPTVMRIEERFDFDLNI